MTNNLEQPRNIISSQRWTIETNASGRSGVLTAVDDRSCAINVRTEIWIERQNTVSFYGDAESSFQRGRIQLFADSITTSMLRRGDGATIALLYVAGWVEERDSLPYEPGFVTLIVRVENLVINRFGGGLLLIFDASPLLPEERQRTELSFGDTEKADSSRFNRTDCKYYVGSRFLGCAVNPCGACSDCQDYEPSDRQLVGEALSNDQA